MAGEWGAPSPSRLGYYPFVPSVSIASIRKERQLNAADHESPSVTIEQSVITLDHVDKSFGSFVAVRDLVLDVAPGEFFALLGPSGCGKTTTLRMIAGFEEPTSGRVLLDGHDQAGIPPHKRSINTVFQQYALFPHLSVFDNVAFGPRSRKMSGAAVVEAVERLLDIVHMEEFSRRKPAQLSGGQQQRVALARALVNRPSALLLDEPLAALDQKLRQVMQFELKRIQRETGTTFVLVTHDQEEALSMSDRIAVMSQGRIEQIGSPGEIYCTPATMFVAGFIGTANMLRATVVDITGATATVALADGTRTRTNRMQSGVEVGKAVTVMLRPESMHLTSTRPDGPSVAVTVSDATFQGAHTRLALRTDDGAMLLGHGKGAAQVGEQGWVTWPDNDAFLLAGEARRVGATGTDIDLVEASL